MEKHTDYHPSACHAEISRAYSQKYGKLPGSVCFALDMFLAEACNLFVGQTCYEHHDRAREDLKGCTWWYLPWPRLALLQVRLYDWQADQNHTDNIFWYLYSHAEVVEHACGMATLQMGEYVPNVSNGVDTYSIREPLGVCAGICPFNFPAMIPLWVIC